MGTKRNPGKFDCYAAAADDEEMFVLLARDPMAPALVQLWADMRAACGEDEAKVAEASACADKMRAWLHGMGRREPEYDYGFDILGAPSMAQLKGRQP